MIDEGYTKYHVDWTRTGALDVPGVAELDRARHRLFLAGLLGFDTTHRVGFGNLSLRLHEGFLISGTQTGHLEHTDGRHYAIVTGYDLDANAVSCRGPVQASSETLTHAAVYETRADAGAVVHVHDQALWRASLGRLPTTPESVAYGTPAMAREFARLLATREFAEWGIAAMAGHEGGLLATGETVDLAAGRILAYRDSVAKA